ncbi:hypothetical protein [Georgenia sp. SUBG003]|uniref:hypothetical protein n=1 Tax=Georgenia sp. SUBG003 TaxID=1497974 RepID=UPI003AB39132
MALTPGMRAIVSERASQARTSPTARRRSSDHDPSLRRRSRRQPRRDADAGPARAEELPRPADVVAQLRTAYGA